jgi:hypothetical protein
MFVLRLRSLNAIETHLTYPRAWKSWLGSKPPSVDVIGDVYSGLSIDGLRNILININRRAWRNKAIHLRKGQSHRVVAFDGHELFSSRARCCDQCLVREITVKGEKVREYYHRVVVAQWVGCTPPGLLDIEMVKPKEGEVTAAKRLLDRVIDNYGRLIDVISADALYLEAPFIQAVTARGKHFIVVMKQEERLLYKDADQLRSLIKPKIIVDGNRTTRLWDIPNLTSFTTLGFAVRVLWAEETTIRTKIIGGKKEQVTEQKRWIWVTDLDQTVPATRIQQWGHDRWDLENRGFNELVTHWHMNHCFVHNPNAIEAFLLTLALAFLTTYLFFERNLKPQARPKTRIALTSFLLVDFANMDAGSIWILSG